MSAPPDVLIVGDSVSMGYASLVGRALDGEAAVRRHEGNGRDSENVVARLDAWLAAGGTPDVVHFNCGLHDVKRPRDADGLQVSPERYEVNLVAILERLRATGAALIWATTTPVLDARHAARKGFDRREADVRAYNAAALRVMAEAGVRIDDLHAAVVAAGVERCLCEDGVHMTPEGNRVLCESVAAAVRDALEDRS